MLPGVGGSELIVIAIVALIVVGPKDLPVLMRKVGQVLGRLRSMAAEFRASFDELARQSELDELRKEVEALRQGQLTDAVRADLDPVIRDIEDGVSGKAGDVNHYYPPGWGHEDEAEAAVAIPAEGAPVAVAAPEAAPAPELVPAPAAEAAPKPAKPAARRKAPAKPRARARGGEG
jgi:sec-independent protein translocase protein TatB